MRKRQIQVLPKCVIITLITHLDEAHHDTPDTAHRERSGHSDRRAAPARGGRPRERPVRRTLAGTMPASIRKFRAWCECEEQSALPALPEVVAAYAAELVDDGKSMSTVRLAVSAIVDAHKRVDLESPVSAGVAETLRGLTRQIGVNQKQAKPLDADALAAIRATAFTPRRSRGGSLESEDSALKRGRLDIALASVLSDAGLRVSETAQLQLRDVLDAEDRCRSCVHRALQDRPGGRGRLCGGHSGDAGRIEAIAAGLRRDA